MTADLRAIQTWKTWTVSTVQLATLTPLVPVSSLPSGATASSAAISVHPYSAVAIRAFGKDTENDTATLRIKGLMTPIDNSKYGSGPQQVLWYGQLVLGSVSGTMKPIVDGKWGAAATWYEVDTYDIAGVAGGHNAANAVTVAGGNQAMLILPTLGYAHLWAEIYDMDGSTGVEATALGIIYREIAMGGVV